MDTLKKINEIRNLIELIKKNEIINDTLSESVRKIYPNENFLNSIEDAELKNLYFDSLLSLSSTIYDYSFNKSVVEELLQILLKFVTDSNIKRDIYEQLLEIKKNEDNPFNDLDYVNRFNEEINKLCTEFENNVKMEEIKSASYHHSVRDGIRSAEIYGLIKRLEYQLNQLFSEENILLLSKSKSNQIKISIIQNLINYFNRPYFPWRVRVTREFEKDFFSKLKKIGFEDKVLESRVNERIYGINFDTKGLINKFDNLKKKIFKK